MYLFKLAPRDMLVLSLLIVCCIAFTGYMVANAEHVENDIINVELHDGVTKEVVFKKLNLAPGESCGYTLVLEREEVVAYDVTFAFEESEDLKLKNYVYVKMEANGIVFYDKLLADAFEEELINLHVDPADTGSGDIKITYYLPKDVGNEAQKAKSTFKLLVTAMSEKPVEGEAQ